MFKPILDRVLIRLITDAPDPEKSIIMPDQYQEPSRRAEVVAVGDVVVLGNLPYKVTDFVKPGQIVRVGEHTNEPFVLDGETLYLTRVQDIRGVELP